MSSSPTSSRETSPAISDSGINDSDAAARLAQLEALLATSLGYDEPLPAPDTTSIEPPSKKLKTEHVDAPVSTTVAAPVEEEVVAFRLFSTQKAPQAVVIVEGDAAWPTVADSRVRAVEDEPADVVERRRAGIEAVAKEGAEILAESGLQPPSRGVTNVATRRIPRTSFPSLPSLAYLNAVLPKPSPPPPPPVKSSTLPPKKKPTVPASTKPIPPRGIKRLQPPRQPLLHLTLPLRLSVLPILKSDKTPTKPIVSLIAPGPKLTKSKNRVSKARRTLIKKREEALLKAAGPVKKKKKPKKKKKKAGAAGATVEGATGAAGGGGGADAMAVDAA